MKNRRDFLKTVGTVGATGIAAAVGVESTVHAQTPAAKPAPASAPVSHAYTFLTAPEAAFIEAAVDRLIPADDLTPGGTDCGVATFIDRQLAGAWGSGDRMYMQGPWDKGVATQGYQSPLTPAEFFRAGIAATNVYCRKMFQKELIRVPSISRSRHPDRAGTRHAGRHRRAGVLQPARRDDDAGFFADPVYGGNRDKSRGRWSGSQA